jgi:hypothetical protein
MQQEKNSNPKGTNVPDSDATNKETLDELEKSEQVSDSKGPADDQAPSPDGTVDDSRKRDDAGPM